MSTYSTGEDVIVRVRTEDGRPRLVEGRIGAVMIRPDRKERYDVADRKGIAIIARGITSDDIMPGRKR